MKDTNKPPCGYPVGLVWSDTEPPLRVWARSRSISNIPGSDGQYVATWRQAAIAVRVEDLTAPNGLNLYKQFWLSFRQWQCRASEEVEMMCSSYHRIMAMVEEQSGIATGHNRKTVVPLAWFGTLVQFLHKYPAAVPLAGPCGDATLEKQISEAISYWVPKFRPALLFLQTANPVSKEQEAVEVSKLNESVELPPPNATDMLMRPLVRKYFPVKGSATLNFCLTFNVSRPQLVHICIGANQILRQQNATLVVPDTQIGGPGNQVMLLIDIPHLCDSFPLVGEYPKASDHDMTYEAIRKAEQLVQDTYQMLSQIICPDQDSPALPEAYDGN